MQTMNNTNSNLNPYDQDVVRSLKEIKDYL